MKEKLQTKFATRQYMISDTFELYYYSTDDVPGVKEHTHTHYEFYLFLEGAISLEIDGAAITAGGSQAVFFKVNTIGEESFLEDVKNLLEEILEE